jgi:rubredoxin-NAD+ reductase
LRITLANGEHIDVDVILSAVGLRADIRLAQEAHLQAERGILVDQFGQTSVKGIYALGDCAQYAQADGNSITLPYVAPIMAAARAIAQSLAGTPTAIDFKPAPVLVKTPSYPIALVAPPLALAKLGNGKANRHPCQKPPPASAASSTMMASCAASRWHRRKRKSGMLY